MFVYSKYYFQDQCSGYRNARFTLYQAMEINVENLKFT